MRIFIENEAGSRRKNTYDDMQRFVPQSADSKTRMNEARNIHRLLRKGGTGIFSRSCMVR